MGFIMDMIEEVLRQLEGWLDLQDCSDKTHSLRVISQMIVEHVKVSDAADYCRIVRAPEDTAELYERFLNYMQQQETDETPFDQQLGNDDLINMINALDAKLDMIITMLERRD